MQALDKDLRGALEKTVKAAREIAEIAAFAAIDQLGVGHDKPEAFLSDAEKALRNRLRTHGKQLGDARDSKSTNPTYGKQEVQHLVQEVAYQHWHRMLFARFLADNDLLMYDGVAVTIEECDELAADEGAKSAWELAGKLASQMLPQIFRPDSPVYQLILPQEHQHRLEVLVSDLPAEVFSATDSLGWVYQYWQANNKDRINKSGVKIGEDELSAVTQLFTEDYMVDFLLDNTLGAWHAGKLIAANPKLIETAKTEDELRQAVSLPDCLWTYLRFVQGQDGKWAPSAGIFVGWPRNAQELRCLDPCMGSGHFVVAMFERLVALRMAEERLVEKAAVIAVIQDNLFGLELDPRCTQIGAFNLALAAWRRVGHCALPGMNLACSGLAPNAKKEEWLTLAGENDRLQRGMQRLHALFNDAPVLGSLINPRLANADLLNADFHELQPLLEKALAQEAKDDTAHEMAVTARGLAKAAEILAGQFTLVATNVPYLGRGKQDDVLKDFCELTYPDAKGDLATCFFERCLDFCIESGSTAQVTPWGWTFATNYQDFREDLLQSNTFRILAKLGEGGFASAAAAGAFVVTPIVCKVAPTDEHDFVAYDASTAESMEDKDFALRNGKSVAIRQKRQFENPDSRILFETPANSPLLSRHAESLQGIKTGDDGFAKRCFWEISSVAQNWKWLQSTVDATIDYGGCEFILRWENSGAGIARLQGQSAWGKRGVAVSLMRELRSSIYFGEIFDSNVAAVVVDDDSLVLPLWVYCASGQFNSDVRLIDPRVNAMTGSLTKIPFDLAHWKKVAEEKYPHGFPKPYSNDPTQWLFNGHPGGSDQPLQVAVARLLGYKWPRQTGSSFPDCPALAEDGLEKLADDDGIVCIPSVGQESSAGDRLLNLLAAAYGTAWSNDVLAQLLSAADHGGKSLETWLRDKFFTQHCNTFANRPFVWHVWDGLPDGFSALLNYHKLNYKTLESLIYTYLGDWISRQKRDVEKRVDGAQEKLASAEVLKKRLEMILSGEKPYDIFVRWKPIEEQPIGWNPDLNDGVRMNIRPFLSVPDVGKRGAGVLRDKPSIKWEKDRGSDVSSAPWYELGLHYDGKVGDRINDHHLTLTEKRAARKELN
jgi:hypothetical protein